MQLSSLLIALQAGSVAAFPWIMDEAMRGAGGAVNLDDVKLEDRADRLEERQVPDGAVPFPLYPGSPSHAAFNLFDAKMQKVSTSGKNRFIPPRPTDQRGPCAGLNAAANHGYLPRDGIATFETIQTGLFAAFGLDQTSTEFLQQTTSFFDGDPLTQRWSIGVDDDRVSQIAGLPKPQLLGNPTGICRYGHSKSENDASITRGDFYAPTMNDNCQSYPKFYTELMDLADKRQGKKGGRLTPPILAEHQHYRKQYSVRTNPFYFAPPFGGVAFTPAAHTFAAELLKNHSAAEPRGFLTQEVFGAFFSYKKVNGRFVQKIGHERIPDNWYKRHDLDQWTLTDIAIGIAQQCATYPTTCHIGGNTGTVNSFSGVRLDDATGGLITSLRDLQDPAKLGCFISQAVQSQAPSSLEKIFTGVFAQQALNAISTKLIPSLAPLGACEGLPKGKTVTQYGNIFPGAKEQAGRTNGPSNGF